MWNAKKRYVFTATWLLFLLWAPAYGFTTQAEAQYTISEHQLRRLESNLTALQKHSEQKQRLLQEQKAQLQKAQEELTRAQEQIKQSRKLNAQTQTSLENAKESFSQYEKEAHHKIKVKTRQRNLWAIISAGLLIGLATR